MPTPAAPWKILARSVNIKAQQPIQNVYSPTHAINIRRPNDREAVVSFEGKRQALDKDFQLYYTPTAKDVGLTALTHRPDAKKDGHFMLLISPRAELAKTQQVPSDMVFVLDTSGSMAGKRIEQARKRPQVLPAQSRAQGPLRHDPLRHVGDQVSGRATRCLGERDRPGSEVGRRPGSDRQHEYR